MAKNPGENPVVPTGEGPSSSAAIGGGESESYWRDKYMNSHFEFSQLKQKLLDETEAEFAKVEGRMLAIKDKFDELSAGMVGHNSELCNDNTTLKLQNKTLMEELAEVRKTMDIQLDHVNNQKRKVELKSLHLEEAMMNKDSTISELQNQLQETRNRIEFLTREVRQQDEEIRELRVVGVEMKEQFDSDLKHVVTQGKLKETELHTMFEENLKLADSNFDEITKELLEKKKDISKIIKKESTREADLRETFRISQRFVAAAVSDAKATVDRLQQEQLLAEKERQKLDAGLKEVAKALESLGVELKSFQLESDVMHERVYQLLGIERNAAKSVPVLPSRVASKQSYHLLKSISSGIGEAISDHGCQILELLETERENIIMLVSSLTEWKTKAEEQKNRFEQHIHDLEDSAQMEKMRYVRDIDFANQKLKVYKKLSAKLHRRLEEASKAPANVDADQDTEGAEMEPSVKRKRNLPVAGTSTKPVISTSIKDNGGKSGTDYYETSCCAEFKYMLECSEEVLQRIEKSELDGGSTINF